MKVRFTIRTLLALMILSCLGILVTLKLLGSRRDPNLYWFENETGILLPSSAEASSRNNAVGDWKRNQHIKIAVAPTDWEKVVSQTPNWSQNTWQVGFIPKNISPKRCDSEFGLPPIYNKRVKFLAFDESPGNESWQIGKLVVLDDSEWTIWFFYWEN